MSRRSNVLVVLAVLVLACAASTLHAWSNDPTQNNLITDATGAQGYPSIVHVGEGNSYVVWEDRLGGGARAYGQRLDGEGNPVWAPGGIAMSDTASYQGVARALAGPELSCYVLWMDARTGHWRVMAQRVDPAGFFHWDPDGVPVCSDTTGQVNYQVVSDGAGGFVVAWADERGGEYTYDIYAQRVDQWGNLLWDAGGAPVCTYSGDQSTMGMAADGSGGAFIAWTDSRAGVDSLDIYLGHVTSAGFAEWTPNGSLVCRAPGWQTLGGVAADGVGGAFLTWRDERTGVDVYAQRMSEYGTPVWDVGGIEVQTSAYSPSIIDDGDAGVILAWLDGRAGGRDIYAQRLDRFGNALWGTGGAPVCTYGDYMEAPDLVSDGAGGVVAVWEDNRPGTTLADIYAQRLDSDGNRLWDEDGIAISTNPGPQEDCVATTDGEGGVIAAWRLGRGENEEGDVYAQRLERNGYLGFPSPSITAVEDYPQDQGGVAVVSWNRSYLDEHPHQVVTDYSVWRKMLDDPPERSTADLRAMSAKIGLPAETVDALVRSGWSYVDNVTASYWWSYGYDAPTYADSTAAGIEVTEYMVVAQTSDQWVFWQSHPFGGYSVDNLAPGAPIALAAASEQTDVELTWSPSGHDDDDLDFYNIYRSGVSGFAPGSGTFVGTAADTLYTDVEPGGGTWYYLVAAEDVHGNEGDASNEAYAETWTGVVELPTSFALRGCHPNPFNPMTVITFDVPESGGKVTLEIFDVRGRLVQTLVTGADGPGRKESVWRGVDENGAPVSSGIYFCRMTAGDYEETLKLTLLK